MKLPTIESLKPRRKTSILIIVLVTLLIILICVTIPFLESSGKIFMGIVLIPSLIIVVMILLMNDNRIGNVSSTKIITTKSVYGKIFQWNDKSYQFSRRSIILFFVGAPLLSLYLLIFFSLDINTWTQELIAKQTHFILESLLNIPSQVVFHPNESVQWGISVSGVENAYGISLLCTAVHIFSILAGIIVCIPHSQDDNASKDIIWRKTKALIVVIMIIYALNLLRLIIVLYTASIGGDTGSIHSLLLYLTGGIGAVIFFIFIYRWVPELFLALYSIPSIFFQKTKTS